MRRMFKDFDWKWWGKFFFNKPYNILIYIFTLITFSLISPVSFFIYLLTLPQALFNDCFYKYRQVMFKVFVGGKPYSSIILFILFGEPKTRAYSLIYEKNYNNYIWTVRSIFGSLAKYTFINLVSNVFVMTYVFCECILNEQENSKTLNIEHVVNNFCANMTSLRLKKNKIFRLGKIFDLK